MSVVTVVYKSGAKVRIRCKSFEVKRRAGTVTEVTWEGAQPRPLHLGVDEIAAVYEGKA